MRRGFKAQAERLADRAREALGKSADAALEPREYARHLGVIILDIAELDISEGCRQQLFVVDSDSWSGMTLKEGDAVGIVINSSHSHARQNSTLAHELAHLVLNHQPVRVDVSPGGMLLLSEFSEDAEAEADWLSAALLLPREALMARRRRGESVPMIAAAYGISTQLCEWRLRMTGVDLQVKRSAAK